MTGIQTKSSELIDRIVTTNNSEQKINITAPLENEKHDNTQSTSSPPSSSYDEDPLYDDMEKYWSDHDNVKGSKIKKDNKNKEQQKFSLQDTLLSFMLKSESAIPWWQQILLYSGIILGSILTSTVVEHQVGTPYLFEISLPFVILSSTLATIVSPVAIEQLGLAVFGSFFSRFFLFIQNGIFWYILITAFSFTLGQLISINA